MVFIVGEIGSGKSSLASAILKELKIVSGNIETNGNLSHTPEEVHNILYPI